MRLHHHHYYHHFISSTLPPKSFVVRTRAFQRPGALVFLSGRRRRSLQSVSPSLFASSPSLPSVFRCGPSSPCLSPTHWSSWQRRATPRRIQTEGCTPLGKSIIWM